MIENIHNSATSYNHWKIPSKREVINPLKNLKFLERFCPNNQWRPPKLLNCSSNQCPLVKAILEYAEDNMVILNIFIKVTKNLFRG